ncbi:hypothetical protein llap_12241 [Limosa lapponica baueri]|uniref:Uncharacterized protein n=1 Tax=Limosa lapponica baueri TaxID=1758121 RepID=A0A2I0TUI5_LIMLA|nr:hypothetical protein llap_12241 [Limosa lapponica baueri]
MAQKRHSPKKERKRERRKEGKKERRKERKKERKRERKRENPVLFLRRSEKWRVKVDIYWGMFALTRLQNCNKQMAVSATVIISVQEGIGQCLRSAKLCRQGPPVPPDP